MPILASVARATSLAIGLLFMVAGMIKLLEPDQFAAIVSSHERIERLALDELLDAKSITYGFSATEVALGLFAILAGLVFRRTRRLELMSVASLKAFWLGLGAYALWMHLDPPPAPTSCGCGVLAGDGPADWRLIALRNFAVAGVLGLAWVVIDRAHPKPATFAS